MNTLVILFAGDSGDGIQTLGQQFALLSAQEGAHVMTFADFPAEIRAPKGTVAGVSSFQVQESDGAVISPGDRADILVAMNPAALRVHGKHLKKGARILLDSDSLGAAALTKAGYETTPVPTLIEQGFQVLPLPLTQKTRESLKTLGLDRSQQDRSRNFFSLGVIASWLSHGIEPARHALEQAFKKDPKLAEANLLALNAGWDYAQKEVTPLRDSAPKDASSLAGTFRTINGNEAMALALVTVSARSGRRLIFSSYPITPASDILHALVRIQGLPLQTVQSEDEIAAIGCALGASYAGALGVTATSGPGLSLKGEFLGLAVMSELPLVVIDVQRAGPSTGMPTKMEQGDLWQSLYGRHGDCPLVVLSARSPAHGYAVVHEAARIALRYMTPVIVLSDASLARGSEVWRIPAVNELPEFPSDAASRWQQHERDPETLAKTWIPPGHEGAMACLGGLEREEGSGQVSYDGNNHERMSYLRRDKILGVVSEAVNFVWHGPQAGDLLLVSWGSTFGTTREAALSLQNEQHRVAHLHIDRLWPLDPAIGQALQQFKQVLVPEVNTGQLAQVLQSRFAHPVISMGRPSGAPLRSQDIQQRAIHLLSQGVP